MHLKDGNLIAKLSAGDMVAIEAKYHAKCLVALYNRASTLQLPSTKNNIFPAPDLDELAFAKLIAHIHETLDCEELAIFKLCELTELFSAALMELGLEPGKLNSTRLKDRVLTAFPVLTTHIQGKDIVLVLKDEIGDVLKQAKEKDSNAWHLAQAAKIVRRDMLQINYSFNGTFPSKCQKGANPVSLKVLIHMILNGATTKKEQAERDPKQACLTIAQLLVFNSISRVRERKELTNTHLKTAEECPLPIYAALKSR